MKIELKKHLNISGKKVLIIGNRSYRNMGDELILLWTVKLLLQQKKEITISCFDPKRLKKFFSQFINITQITFIHEIPKGFRSTVQRIKKGWLKELKYFRSTDSVILGWGEIITEENSSAYRYRLIGMRPFLLRKTFNKEKELIIMWWIQIPKNKTKLRLFKFLLNKTSHLYLRDFQAVKEIQQFWYPKTEFFMDTSYFAYNWNEVTAKKKENKYIIVNLNKNGEQFLNDIINDIKSYIKRGYEIYYVPIAKGNNQYYQDKYYKNIIEKESNKELKIVDRESNFEQFTETLKGADKVISTRLHLFLIASFMEISTKVYPYQRKILKMQEVIENILN